MPRVLLEKRIENLGMKFHSWHPRLEKNDWIYNLEDKSGILFVMMHTMLKEKCVKHECAVELGCPIDVVAPEPSYWTHTTLGILRGYEMR